MPHPSFSVVIPCHNRSELLVRALRTCLSQTAPPLEVIVVDDASEPSLADSLAALRGEFDRRGIALTCLRRAFNGGPAAARNEGWASARGDYIAFLDSDDLWHPDKLAVVAAALGRTPALCAFHGHETLPEKADALRTPVAPAQFDTRLVGTLRGLLRNYAPTPCMVVRRSVEDRFDESMRYVEDHDLWLRVSRRGPLLRIAGPPLCWLGRPLMTPGGLSAHRWKMRAGEMRMYAKFCRGPRLALLPALLLWSAAKHGYAALRRAIVGVAALGPRARSP